MERYKTIIDDWDQFREACQDPIISSVRRNPLKADNDFESRLSEAFEFEHAAWNNDIYRLETDKPGNSLLHWLGDYYVQEESASVPIEVLDPQPGEHILDMCAAPGGKSTQIAGKLGNQGLVVANDDAARRLKSLHANTYRTGSACIVATNYDGRQIPGNERFDRLLVDAPCSGEADKARRAVKKAQELDEDTEKAFLESGADLGEIKGLAELQKQLLERASELLKPGGTLVYSTCTFAPEENEEVVQHGLENTELELKDVETDVEHVRGITEFENREYSSEMSKTIRIYPHHLDSGGMYVAKFTKPEDSIDETESESRPISESEAEARNYLKTRFGVDIENTKYILREVAGDIWIMSEDAADSMDEFETHTNGIRFIRITGQGLKPTTYGLQLLSDELERNVVELEKNELVTLLNREGLIDTKLESKGYCALKWDGQVIGCGFYMDGTVSSRVPKGRSKELAAILEG